MTGINKLSLMRAYSECDLFVCYLVVFLYWSKPLPEDWGETKSQFEGNNFLKCTQSRLVFSCEVRRD